MTRELWQHNCHCCLWQKLIGRKKKGQKKKRDGRGKKRDGRKKGLKKGMEGKDGRKKRITDLVDKD